MAGDLIALRAAAEEGYDLAEAIGDRFVSRQCRFFLALAARRCPAATVTTNCCCSRVRPANSPGPGNGELNARSARPLRTWSSNSSWGTLQQGEPDVRVLLPKRPQQPGHPLLAERVQERQHHLAALGIGLVGGLAHPGSQPGGMRTDWRAHR